MKRQDLSSHARNDSYVSCSLIPTANTYNIELTDLLDGLNTVESSNDTATLDDFTYIMCCEVPMMGEAHIKYETGDKPLVSRLELVVSDHGVSATEEDYGTEKPKSTVTGIDIGSFMGNGCTRQLYSGTFRNEICVRLAHTDDDCMEADQMSTPTAQNEAADVTQVPTLPQRDSTGCVPQIVVTDPDLNVTLFTDEEGASDSSGQGTETDDGIDFFVEDSFADISYGRIPLTIADGDQERPRIIISDTGGNLHEYIDGNADGYFYTDDVDEFITDAMYRDGDTVTDSPGYDGMRDSSDDTVGSQTETVDERVVSVMQEENTETSTVCLVEGETSNTFACLDLSGDDSEIVVGNSGDVAHDLANGVVMVHGNENTWKDDTSGIPEDLTNETDAEVNDVEEMVPTLIEDQINDIIQSLQDVAIKSMVNRLPACDLKDLVCNLPEDVIKDMVSGLPGSVLKNIISRLSGYVIKDFLGNLSGCVIKDIACYLSDDMLNSMISVMPADIVKDPVGNLPGVVIKESMNSIPEYLVKDILCVLPDYVIKETVFDLPELIFEEIVSSLPGYLIKDIVSSAQDDNIKDIVDKLPEEVIQESANNLPPYIIKDFIGRLPADAIADILSSIHMASREDVMMTDIEGKSSSNMSRIDALIKNVNFAKMSSSDMLQTDTFRKNIVFPEMTGSDILQTDTFRKNIVFTEITGSDSLRMDKLERNVDFANKSLKNVDEDVVTDVIMAETGEDCSIVVGGDEAVTTITDAITYTIAYTISNISAVSPDFVLCDKHRLRDTPTVTNKQAAVSHNTNMRRAKCSTERKVCTTKKLYVDQIDSDVRRSISGKFSHERSVDLNVKSHAALAQLKEAVTDLSLICVETAEENGSGMMEDWNDRRKEVDSVGLCRAYSSCWVLGRVAYNVGSEVLVETRIAALEHAQDECERVLTLVDRDRSIETQFIVSSSKKTCDSDTEICRDTEADSSNVARDVCRNIINLDDLQIGFFRETSMSGEHEDMSSASLNRDLTLARIAANSQENHHPDRQAGSRKSNSICTSNALATTAMHKSPAEYCSDTDVVTVMAEPHPDEKAKKNLSSAIYSNEKTDHTLIVGAAACRTAAADVGDAESLNRTPIEVNESPCSSDVNGNCPKVQEMVNGFAMNSTDVQYAGALCSRSVIENAMIDDDDAAVQCRSQIIERSYVWFQDNEDNVVSPTQNPALATAQLHCSDNSNKYITSASKNGAEPKSEYAIQIEKNEIAVDSTRNSCGTSDRYTDCGDSLESVDAVRSGTVDDDSGDSSRTTVDTAGLQKVTTSITAEYFFSERHLGSVLLTDGLRNSRSISVTSAGRDIVYLNGSSILWFQFSSFTLLPHLGDKLNCCCCYCC